MVAAQLAGSPARRSREPPPPHPKGRERGKKSPSLSVGETLNLALRSPPLEEPRSQEGPVQSALIRLSVARFCRERREHSPISFLWPRKKKTKPHTCWKSCHEYAAQTVSHGNERMKMQAFPRLEEWIHELKNIKDWRMIVKHCPLVQKSTHNAEILP